MEWLKNLSTAIDYIEDNLDNDISYDEAAQIACCSSFYFQRLFSYVSGISLSEYIRRRRMTQAAFELQRTNAKVIDIALKYGYTSPTSFNRAFQSVHNIPPDCRTQSGKHVKRIPRNSFFSSNHRRKCYGIEICVLSNQSPKGILGVSVYESPQRIFYYIAVATDAPVPPDMFEFEIPAATWVVFENNGFFKENVQSVFKRFYTEWLPFSGYEYAELPDIEVYPVCEETPISGHSEVWIAINKDKEGKKCTI